MSADAGPAVPPDDAPAARRLHPGTMLVAFVSKAPSTLLGVPALLAVARAELQWLLIGTVVALLVAGLSRWLAWSRFSYTLTGDAVVIEQGVFGRHRRTIPYARLADVGIERGPLHRLFGLARVTLETGGGGADDGVLDSVTAAEAERLRAVIRQRRASGAVVPGGSEASAPPLAPPVDAPLFAMSTRRVLGWGLFNFSLVWIAVGLGALQQLGEAFDPKDVWLKEIGARRDVARTVPLLVWAQIALAGAFAAIALGIVAGLIRTLLRDYGYRIDREPGRFRRVRGLLTRSEAVIALPRIQLAAIDTGPVRRRLGWSRLRAQVLGGEGANGRQDLAPFARPEEVDRLLEPLHLRLMATDALTPVARGHLWRALLRRVGPPLLLIVIAAVFAPPALAASPLLSPLLLIALLERRHHRYRVAAGLLQVQRGVIRRTVWIVPTARIQTVTLRRGWLQRRLGLATVMVDTAGGGMFTGPNVHDLSTADAQALVAALRQPA